MAEETVVRMRIEQIVEGDEVVARVVAQTEKLAGAEARLASAARPAATSISKLQKEEQQAGAAAATASPKVDKLGDEIAQTGKQAVTAGGQIGKAGAEMSTLGRVASGLGGKLGAVAAGFLSFQAIRGILSQAVEAISEAESTTALLGNRVVATGGMAERSAAQIEAASSRLSAALGVDDEAISQAADALLQYDRVAGDVFDRVTRTALDMSAGTQDAAGSAEFLGKVLQDVEEGLPLLNRQWRLFSDAQEAAIVKLARSGKTVEAQNAVLDAMETRVGGAAAAWRDTLPGAISAASVEWENQLELLQSGLSPAIRELAEEFVAWSRSARGQEEIVQLGRDLGEVLSSAAGFVRSLSGALEDLDSHPILKIVDTGFRLAEGLGRAEAAIGPLSDAFNPLMAYNLRVLDLIAQGIEKVEGVAKTATAAVRGLDPRAVAGAGAGIAASTGGMTPAERKAWDEAEAEAFRAFERNRRAREDAAHRAAEDAKRHAAAQESAHEAALKLVSAIEEESSRRVAGLAILQQEGRTREELLDTYREAEVQAKAEAKVQEIRAAYLRAGKVLTEQNAAAIRAWVIEAERAADATAKWLAVTGKLPAVLEALPTQGIVIPARISFENFGQAGSNAPSVDVEAVIKWLTISDEADAANAQMWADWSAQQGESLAQLAEGFRASLASPRDELETTLRAINALAQAADAASEPLLSAAEAERLRAEAVAHYTMQQIDQQMAAWGGFFYFLGDSFGGLFSQLASAIQGVQSGISTGRGLGQAMGGTSSAAALGGAWGGTIAVFVELYKFASDLIAKHKSEKYGTSATYALANDQAGRGYGYSSKREIQQASLDLVHQIEDVVEAFEDALRINVTDLAQIEIKIRNDGKSIQAWLAGVYVGTFTETATAIQAALAQALSSGQFKANNFSDLMKEGLASWTAPDPEGLMEFLQQLREISDLDLSPAAVQVQETVRHLLELREALLRMPASAETVSGLQDIGASIVSVFQNWADSISGRQKTPEEDLAARERDKRIFESEQDLFVAREKLRVLDLKQEAEALKRKTTIIRGEGEGEGARVRIRAAYLESLIQLTEAEADVENERLALIEAQIAAIEAIIAEVEKIDIGEITIPRGGGGLGRDLKSEREDLRREIARILAESRGSLHLIFFDLQAAIADLTKRWKEAKLPLADLTAGIAALTAAAQKQARLRMDELAGIGTDFTRSLEEGLAYFRELRELGRGKTGIPDWKVDVREKQFKERMAADFQARLAEFGGISNPMAEIAAGAARLNQELTALAEATGMSAEDVAAARAAIAEGAEFQREQAVSGIIGQLFGYLKGSQKHAADIEKFERRQIELQFKIWEAQLKFLQAWDAETAEIFADAKDAALAMDRGAAATDRFASRMEAYWQSQQDAADRWKQAMEAGAQAVQEWRAAIKEFSDSTHALFTDESQTNLTQAEQLAEAERRYEELLARAQGGDAGAVRELIRARAEWIAEGRESEAGGAGFDRIWRRILETSGDFLETAQGQEDNIFQEAFKQAMLADVQNTERLTTAVYDAALIVANKIDELLAEQAEGGSGGGGGGAGGGTGDSGGGGGGTGSGGGGGTQQLISETLAELQALSTTGTQAAKQQFFAVRAGLLALLSSSGLMTAALFAQITALTDAILAAPGFAGGGVVGAPRGGSLAFLHGPEAVVPLAGGGVPVSWVGGSPSSSSASMAPVVSLLAAMERRLARVEDHLGNVSGSAEDIAKTNKQMATGEGRLASEVKRLRGGNRQRG